MAMGKRYSIVVKDDRDDRKAKACGDGLMYASEVIVRKTK